MPPLILRRAPIGWNQDDYDVLENGVIVGRIFFLDAVGPHGRPWMWASGHNGDIERTAHGYEPSCAGPGSTLRTLSLAFHIAPYANGRVNGNHKP